MNYRTLFFEFLSNYREYRFDTFQLLLFDNNEEDNILKAINDKEQVDIYQVKNAQTFYKKVHFNNLSATVANLLFISNQPTVLEISKVDNDLRKCLDLYTNKSIYDLNCKYLLIYPIYKEEQLLGGFFIYSNYQIIWQIQETKVFKFLKDLEKACCEAHISEIEEKSTTDFWIYKNKGMYLSKDMAKLLDCKQYNTSFDVQGKSLLKKDEFLYLNGLVETYEPIKKQPIKSSIELGNLNLKKYTLIYSRALDNDDIFCHVEKVKCILKKIDGSFGKYNIYHTSSNSITIIFEEEFSKKEINNVFNEIPYIMVRSGFEVKKNVQFLTLVDYLNLSPMEEFNYQYYEFYCSNLILEKREQVLSNYNSSKIQITPLINALNMQLHAYLINDMYDLHNSNKENKLKSIKAISKIVEEYKNYTTYIELSLNDIFNGARVHVAFLNVLKKLAETYKCYFIIDYDANNFYEISKLWDSFSKYVIIKENNNGLVEALTLKDQVEGVYLNSNHYLDLIKNNEKVGLELTDFAIKSFNQVMVKTVQTNITKYNNKKILLFCLGV